jgi:hypothetical protein
LENPAAQTEVCALGALLLASLANLFVL